VTVVLAFLIQSTVLLGLAWLASLWARRRGPAVEATVLRSSLVAVVLLMATSPWLSGRLFPQADPVIAVPEVEQRDVALVEAQPEPVDFSEEAVPIEELTVEDATEEATSTPNPGPQASGETSRAEESAPVVGATNETQPPSGGGWGLLGWGLIAYTLVALVLVARLGLGHVLLSRIRSKGVPISNGPAYEQVQNASKEFGIGAPQVVAHPALDGPFVGGLFHPVLFVPKAFADDYRPEYGDAVLRHEVAHIAHRDWIWNPLRLLIASVLWFQPLVWWASRRLETVSELRADRVAVREDDHVKPYAEYLLSLAQTRAEHSRSAAYQIGAASGPSTLRTRVQDLTSGLPRPTAGFSRWAALAVGAVALLGVVALVQFIGPSLANLADENGEVLVVELMDQSDEDAVERLRQVIAAYQDMDQLAFKFTEEEKGETITFDVLYESPNKVRVDLQASSTGLYFDNSYLVANSETILTHAPGHPSYVMFDLEEHSLYSVFGASPFPLRFVRDEIPIEVSTVNGVTETSVFAHLSGTDNEVLEVVLLGSRVILEIGEGNQLVSAFFVGNDEYHRYQALDPSLVAEADFSLEPPANAARYVWEEPGAEMSAEVAEYVEKLEGLIPRDEPFEYLIEYRAADIHSFSANGLLGPDGEMRVEYDYDYRIQVESTFVSDGEVLAFAEKDSPNALLLTESDREDWGVALGNLPYSFSPFITAIPKRDDPTGWVDQLLKDGDRYWLERPGDETVLLHKESRVPYGFRLPGGRLPSGGVAPLANVMTLVLDEETGRPIEFTRESVWPDNETDAPAFQNPPVRFVQFGKAQGLDESRFDPFEVTEGREIHRSYREYRTAKASEPQIEIASNNLSDEAQELLYKMLDYYATAATLQMTVEREVTDYRRLPNSPLYGPWTGKDRVAYARPGQFHIEVLEAPEDFNGVTLIHDDNRTLVTQNRHPYYVTVTAEDLSRNTNKISGVFPHKTPVYRSIWFDFLPGHSLIFDSAEQLDPVVHQGEKVSRILLKRDVQLNGHELELWINDEGLLVKATAVYHWIEAAKVTETYNDVRRDASLSVTFDTTPPAGKKAWDMEPNPRALPPQPDLMAMNDRIVNANELNFTAKSADYRAVAELRDAARSTVRYIHNESDWRLEMNFLGDDLSATEYLANGQAKTYLRDDLTGLSQYWFSDRINQRITQLVSLFVDDNKQFVNPHGFERTGTQRLRGRDVVVFERVSPVPLGAAGRVKALPRLTTTDSGERVPILNRELIYVDSETMLPMRFERTSNHYEGTPYNWSVDFEQFEVNGNGF
jgi:beta-lactamase regulating signal transducer with metallopeptidase domain